MKEWMEKRQKENLIGEICKKGKIETREIMS